MNYLAHLYLADPHTTWPTEEALIGNLLGDFVKGPLSDQFAPAVVAGIRLHRQIDSFSDAHPVFLRSKWRIEPPYRRYGGILVDLFYDHYLAIRWADYARQPLPQFCDRTYDILAAHFNLLPPRMQRSVRYMLDHDLLQSYQHIDGIRRALDGVSRRLRRPLPLQMAVADLDRHYAAFAADFDDFFPQLIGFVTELSAPADSSKGT